MSLSADLRAMRGYIPVCDACTAELALIDVVAGRTAHKACEDRRAAYQAARKQQRARDRWWHAELQIMQTLCSPPMGPSSVLIVIPLARLGGEVAESITERMRDAGLEVTFRPARGNHIITVGDSAIRICTPANLDAHRGRRFDAIWLLTMGGGKFEPGVESKAQSMLTLETGLLRKE